MVQAKKSAEKKIFKPIANTVNLYLKKYLRFISILIIPFPLKLVHKPQFEKKKQD